MELYAAGFNGLNATSLDSFTGRDDPEDLLVFKKVLESPKIEPPVSRLCYTIVRTGTGEHGIRVGGLPDKLRNLAALHDREFDLKCVEAGNGQVVVAEGAARDEDPTSTPREPTVVPVPDDKSTGSIHIVQYPTYEEAMQRINRVEHSQLRNAESVVAYEVGFACLTPDGKVWTWGDPRYPDCLGRETHLEQDRLHPCPVHDLNEWPVGPIVKISAGGYTLAALNKTGDLYCWGSPPKQFQILDEVSGSPNLVEVAGGKEVVDVAVGLAHMLVLAADGMVYGIGSNENGQLGLGEKQEGREARLEDWTKLPVAVTDGYSITGVSAGPMSSFILTEKRPIKEP